MGKTPMAIVPLKWKEHGVYGDLILTCPKPSSIYVRGTIGCFGAGGCSARALNP